MGARPRDDARRLPRARENASPVILSSGFHELIEPVLEREQVERRVRANGVDARPDGWRPIWRDEAVCATCGDACKRRSLAGERSSSSATATPTAAQPSQRSACSRATVSPRYLDEQGIALRAVRDPARRCCCAFLSRTTSSSRPGAFAPSAPTSRTGSSTERSTAPSAGVRCASSRGPGGVDVEPLDDETRPVVAAAARRAVRPAAVLRVGGARPAARAGGRTAARLSAAAAPDPFEALVTSITAQQISLFAAVAIRNRLIERLGDGRRRGVGVPDAANGSQRRARSELVEVGFYAEEGRVRGRACA